MFDVQQFGDRDTHGPRLLVLGGVHGDEPPGVEGASELARRLGKVDVNGLITVIPIVNEPAWKRQARCADDGLDLARTFPGRHDGSVTERIAATATKWIQDSTALIDLHSGGRAMEICPLVGYMMVQDRDVLAQQRQMAAAFGLPIIWGTSDSLDGRSLSIARDHGIPAVYAEYGSGQSCDKIADSYANSCLEVARYLGLIGGQRQPGILDQLVVEETGPGSGHLQICHPAPSSGTFSSLADLGDAVEKGQPIGTVTSVDHEQFPIAADKTGKLIVRRADPRVERGDCLGVVLGH